MDISLLLIFVYVLSLIFTAMIAYYLGQSKAESDYEKRRADDAEAYAHKANGPLRNPRDILDDIANGVYDKKV